MSRTAMTRTRDLKLSAPEEPLVHKLHPAMRRGESSVIRVAVAGAGGNGSQMITLLARMDISLRAKGLGRLAVDLYDPEHVSMANMGRQLFYPEERGLPKATCLITRANLGFGLGGWGSCGAYPSPMISITRSFSLTTISPGLGRSCSGTCSGRARLRFAAASTISPTTARTR